MVGQTKAPTGDEKRRLAVLKEHVPCIPCLVSVKRIRLPTIQHLVEGFKRLGHTYTYPSCAWHHQANPESWSVEYCEEVLGPSLENGKRTFQAAFGLERDLVKVADFLIESYLNAKWDGYKVPANIRRLAIELWTHLKT